MACACVHAVDHAKFKTTKIYSQLYENLHQQKFSAYTMTFCTAACVKLGNYVVVLCIETEGLLPENLQF